MQSLILIDNLRKSLYTRLYYALVDSEYLIKAISEQEISTMLEDVKEQKYMITYVNKFMNNTNVNRNTKVPAKYKDEWEKRLKIIDDKLPLRTSLPGTAGWTEVNAENMETTVKRKEQYRKQLKLLGKYIISQYPEITNKNLDSSIQEEELESSLLMDYIKRNFIKTNANDSDNPLYAEIKEDLDKYYEGKNVERLEMLESSNQQQGQRNKKITNALSEVKEKIKSWEEKLRIETLDESKKLPKSKKLVEAWMKDTSRKIPNKITNEKNKNLSSYTTMLKLIDLVESLRVSDPKSTARLNKFITEFKIDPEDKVKLVEILTELEKEQKQYNKREGRQVKITPTAIEAKSDGISIGKKSKYGKLAKTGTRSLRINYSDSFRTFKAKQGDVLKQFEKLDLNDNGWYNSNILDVIPAYWIKKSGYKKGLDAWDSEPSDVKTKFIKKVNSIIPEYPKLNQDGVSMKSPISILYNDIWDDYSSVGNNSPEDFAYFLQGIRDGLGNDTKDTMAADFLKLKEFKEDILPQLIKAVKRGIIIDENNLLDFRLGPIFSKIMGKLGDNNERKEIIQDLISIVKGESLSNKYAGRNAEELKSIEKDIVNMISEKLYDRTILSYIMTTFFKIYKGQTLIRNLFKVESPEVEVEFLETVSGAKPDTSRAGDAIRDVPAGTYIKDKETQKKLNETRKSLENLLIGLREQDDVLLKEDTGLILESLSKTQKKKVKAILNIADPTEYFGHDFLKLAELVKVLKSLGVVKGDKKLNKKILKLEDENLKVVKLATRLRKDYENLYRDLREMIYPKSGE